MAALFEWQRKSELSADRAGLLATQDPAVGLPGAHEAGQRLRRPAELDQTSFFAQGQEYLDTADLRDSVLKLHAHRAGHPPVRRRARGRAAALGRLRRVHAVLGGTYPRRDEDAAASMSDAAKQAADSYTEAFSSSQDALGKLVHDVAGFFGSAKLWFDEQLRRTRD